MEKQTLTRRELYELVWSEPMLSLAKKFNISDVGLRKICKKLNIPLPKAGHWQKLQYGKKVHQPELPSDNAVKQQVKIGQRGTDEVNVVSPVKTIQHELEEQLKTELDVPLKLMNPHSLVITTQKILNEQEPDRWEFIGTVSSRRGNGLDTRVSKKNVPRALRLWNTLIKALALRGHDVLIQYDHTYVNVEGHSSRIKLHEKCKRQTNKDSKWDRTTYVPTNIFSFQFGYSNKEWKDGKLPLENQLSRIIAYLELDGREWKESRLKNEKLEEERKARERAALELEQRRKDELNKFVVVLQDASRWHHAANLRNYIAEVEHRALQKRNLDQETYDWLEWAKKKADWYDPFVETEDELLVTVDRNNILKGK